MLTATLLIKVLAVVHVLLVALFVHQMLFLGTGVRMSAAVRIEILDRVKAEVVVRYVNRIVVGLVVL